MPPSWPARGGPWADPHGVWVGVAGDAWRCSRGPHQPAPLVVNGRTAAMPVGDPAVCSGRARGCRVPGWVRGRLRWKRVALGASTAPAARGVGWRLFDGRVQLYVHPSRAQVGDGRRAVSGSVARRSWSHRALTSPDACRGSRLGAQGDPRVGRAGRGHGAGAGLGRSGGSVPVLEGLVKPLDGGTPVSSTVEVDAAC